jgi:hypothetical protein
MTDIIMFAAKKLPQPFSVEDLVVEAWKLDKEKIGLDGFKQFYPNNNKILSALMGKKGLYNGGKLVKLGKGMLQIR